MCNPNGPNGMLLRCSHKLRQSCSRIGKFWWSSSERTVVLCKDRSDNEELKSADHLQGPSCGGGVGQERKRHINLGNHFGTPAGCPCDTRRDKQGSTGRCPRNFLLFVYYRKTDIFCRDTGRVSQAHPAVQGFQKFYAIFSFVPFLLPRWVPDLILIGFLPIPGPPTFSRSSPLAWH